jgi:acetyl-CoA C-acetyltransferase/acetyl-CoA acyltransferase
MARATVAGAGMTKFAVHDTTLQELFAGAAFKAIDDAGVGTDEVDALYLGNAMGGMTEHDIHLGPTMAAHLGMSGIPCQRFEDACATSSNAFKHAVQAVEAGEHDVVLAGGVERCSQSTGIETPGMTRVFDSVVHKQTEQPAGMTAPGFFALLTKRHMHEHGTTREQLAEIAVKNHDHGHLNPRAQLSDQITVEDVLESPIVADPFHLYDCCPFSDGASAVVVTSDDAAGSFDDPVNVAGIGHATDTVPIADNPSPHTTGAARHAAEQAYDQADVDPADVDFAEVHDCFTGEEIIAVEALGLYEDGEAGPAAAEGEFYIDGATPINPSGGLKAKGHPLGATGTAQLVELTDQLRDDAGERQVEGATTGVAHNLGGDASTTVVSVLEARA